MYKTKDKVLSLRLSTDEYDYLKTSADDEEMKMSSYLRKLLQDKYDKERGDKPHNEQVD